LYVPSELAGCVHIILRRRTKRRRDVVRDGHFNWIENLAHPIRMKTLGSDRAPLRHPAEDWAVADLPSL
jgi:hypothetical protein